MATRGREVLRGRVQHRKKGSSSWKKRLVIVYCGITQDSGKHSAQIQIFEDYENQRTSQKKEEKPKKAIDLAKAKLESSLSNSNSPSVSATGSPHGGTLATSPNPSGYQTPTAQHLFQVITPNETHEFRTDSENERLRWGKLLGLLVLFPYSTIPEEPKTNPIKESFRAKLDPKWYGADSVWPVYVLPEEVGSRIHIIGMNVMILKNGVPNHSMGKLEIVHPGDPHNPIVSWDRDKMRRAGKTGNLVFIEIGRRCEGGPGLVWMFAGYEEAQALRGTLHNFLFQGDGKAVAIPTQQYPLYDVPRPSFNSSLPSSYNKRGSFPNGYSHVRRDSLEPDSGHPSSPLSVSNSPRSVSLEGPPVRLDKHPSIRRKNLPRDRVVSRRTSPPNSCERSESIDSDLDGCLFDESRSRSESPPDQEIEGDTNSYPDDPNPITGTMDLDMSVGPPLRSNSEPPSRHSPKVALASRSNTTASCEPNREYERMIHPHAALYNGSGDYVYMKRADKETQRSAPIPVVPQRPAEPQPRKRSPSNGESPRRRTDRLPPIVESQVHHSKDRSSAYENHPLPLGIQNSQSVVYQPNYENVSMAHAERRGSQSREQYENVTVSGEQIASEPSNLQKRGSLRRQRSDKEEVMLPLTGGNGPYINGTEVKSPSPPRNGTIYADIQTTARSDEINHTVRQVKYSTVDFCSTNGVQSIQRQRSEELQRALSEKN